ncbi:MAG: hypothetical protein ACT4PZ_01130 [Panacagrimonas sp.]
MIVTPDSIDELLRAPKLLVGIGHWADNPPREGALQLRMPLDVGGAGRTGLELRGNTNRYWTPQDGCLLLVFHGGVIERMNVFPPATHANPFLTSLPKSLRGLVLKPGAHRYYPWTLNRRWPRPTGDNLRVGEEIDEPLDSFEAAIKYFCTRCNISGVPPSPPFEPRLDLR